MLTFVSRLELHQFEINDDDFEDAAVPAPVLSGAAQLPSATAAPLESRLKPDSKDAFLERQRLKELEETKKAKQEKLQREAELKRKVEEERLARLGSKPASAAAAPALPEIDSEEAKRQFELKQRQKEAEETKRKKAAELEDRERIRREMDAEKAQRAAKFGTANKPKEPEPTDVMDTRSEKEIEADKRKQEYLREKAEEAAARERARRQIEEDKERRAGKVSFQPKFNHFSVILFPQFLIFLILGEERRATRAGATQGEAGAVGIGQRPTSTTQSCPIDISR